jgi:hypothetical protein
MAAQRSQRYGRVVLRQSACGPRGAEPDIQFAGSVQMMEWTFIYRVARNQVAFGAGAAIPERKLYNRWLWGRYEQAHTSIRRAVAGKLRDPESDGQHKDVVLASAKSSRSDLDHSSKKHLYCVGLSITKPMAQGETKHGRFSWSNRRSSSG